MEKIRLNQQKRQLLKKEWQHTVYNNMPMQVEEDLRLAQENYRSVREDVWDNVITPQVEKNFPMADMKCYKSIVAVVITLALLIPIVVSTSNLNSWTQVNSNLVSLWTLMNTWLCITKRYRQKVIKRLSKLSMMKHRNKTIQTTQCRNTKCQGTLADIAKANGTYEDFALMNDGRNYGWTEHAPTSNNNDYGKYRK
jgi:hypothetical protein